MRWATPQHGDKRSKRKFCLLPLSGSNTTVWLEYVTVHEEYGKYYDAWVVTGFTLEDKS